MNRLRLSYALILLAFAIAAALWAFEPNNVALAGALRLLAICCAMVCAVVVWATDLNTKAPDWPRQLDHLQTQRRILVIFLVAGAFSCMQWFMYFDRFENPSWLNPALNLLNFALTLLSAGLLVVKGAKSLARSKPDTKRQPINSQTATS